MIIPIFKTDYSLGGRSILTLEKTDEIKDNYPVSLYAIAKKHKLKEIYLVEDSMSGFFNAYELFDKTDCLLKFGVSIITVGNPDEKEERNESKVWVFIKNSEGYKDLCKLWNKYSTNQDLFYYHPRILWDDFVSLLTDNLQVVNPPYDSYLHKNEFCSGRITPNFGARKVINTFCSKNDIHFGDELEAVIKEKDPTAQEVHLCYYYKESDFKSWLTMKCLVNGSSFEDPNFEWCTSNRFSFESYCNKAGVLF